jgi:hypothetical protein
MNEVETNSGFVRGPRRRLIDARAAMTYWPVALVLGIAVIVRCFIWLNSDVSWLLTLAEQVLAGARAYVDYSEPNPPASIIIYMPAILLAHLLSISAEFAVTILIFSGALASLWLVARALPDDKLLQPRDRPLLFALACALLLILPGDNFAERENIALMAILPMLAVNARRADDAHVGIVLAVLAGIGGGIAIGVKPYFALALLLPLPYVLWRRHAHRRSTLAALLAPEHIAAAFIVLAYGALLVWLFPDYTRQTLPLVLTLYVPLRYSLPLMLANPSVILVLVMALAALGLGWREFRTPLLAVASLAALGFTAALVIQGKGWPYHGYPAVALSLFVLGTILIRRLAGFLHGRSAVKRQTIELMLGAALFACVYALASYWLLQEPSRSYLVSVVARLVPPHPKIVSIYGAPGLAFPLTRKLDGTPLGRTPFQWISAYTDRMLTAGGLDPTGNTQISDPALRRTIEGYARQDRRELADMIRTRHPDVILVGGAGERRWAFSHPEVATALRPYHLAKTVGEVEIWLPRDASRARSP